MNSHEPSAYVNFVSHHLLMSSSTTTAIMFTDVQLGTRPAKLSSLSIFATLTYAMSLPSSTSYVSRAKSSIGSEPVPGCDISSHNRTGLVDPWWLPGGGAMNQESPVSQMTHDWSSDPWISSNTHWRTWPFHTSPGNDANVSFVHRG